MGVFFDRQEVDGLPLPRLLIELMRDGRWKHPGDDVLQKLICFMPDPVDFMNVDGMELESKIILAGYPDFSRKFHEARGTLTESVPSLPWIDANQAIMIAANRESGADVGIALDYRTSRDDPRVVASEWCESEHFWREVTPTLSAFVDIIGLREHPLRLRAFACDK